MEGMYLLDTSPQVHQYLGMHLISSKKQAADIIRFVRQQYENNGIGRWTILEKETHTFIGWAGLKRVKEEVNGYSDYYDLGYRLLPEFWGRGIASECAQASLEFGFSHLQLDTIYAAAHCANAASLSILQKMGFTRHNTFFYFGADQYWFSVEKSHWAKSTGS